MICEHTISYESIAPGLLIIESEEKAEEKGKVEAQQEIYWIFKSLSSCCILISL